MQDDRKCTDRLRSKLEPYKLDNKTYLTNFVLLSNNGKGTA